MVKRSYRQACSLNRNCIEYQIIHTFCYVFDTPQLYPLTLTSARLSLCFKLMISVTDCVRENALCCFWLWVFCQSWFRSISNGKSPPKCMTLPSITKGRFHTPCSKIGMSKWESWKPHGWWKEVTCTATTATYLLPFPWFLNLQDLHGFISYAAPWWVGPPTYNPDSSTLGWNYIKF